MSLLHLLPRSARPSLLTRTRLQTKATAPATAAAISLGLSSLFSKHYSSAATAPASASASEAVTPARENKPTPLYTFEDMSEQEVLFAEMRHHKVSWGAIGAYYGKSSLEVFYGYIPIATRAYKHQWTSRMTSEDVAEHLRLQGQQH
ncbi:hypothetical protein BG015_010476 [Linnemannia schmuckeri]|uniref:Uncharacterized protein n=1 Tax=Linnemannia schmuckeri TaxID=64567 RepID=A0A9P5VEG1_9FUNG|nr:hypothetical protein BG015_010476 [Linnemannia schmuckeri]